MSLIPILTTQEAASWLHGHQAQTVSGFYSQKSALQQAVAAIFDAVCQEGTQAIRRYGEQFSECQPRQAFELTQADIQAALQRVPQETLVTLQAAAQNIQMMADAVVSRVKEPVMISPETGLRAGVRWVAVDRALCYAPGGRYPLPSTALMTVITAKSAGVKEIFLTSPNMSDVIVAAGHLVGAHRFFRLGGAHAIAAFALGTEETPRVDMIVGPGNAYVSEAKRLVREAGLVGIDMLAGPSEVAIIADDTANAEWIALDLLAQAEHDPDARAILLTPSDALACEVSTHISECLTRLRLPAFVQKSLAGSAIFVLPSLHDCAEMANQIAAEHLHVQVEVPELLTPLLRHAGTLFVGHRATVPLGDYAAGPNHTLPTSGAARFCGGLTPLTFLRPQGWVEVQEPPPVKTLMTTVALATAEGLVAHAAAAQARI
ncbi:MAG: histidinol dehydrogenase [Vampirovibrionales bacterium]|nr:histidinol dehydrogenase [Vampirovibrionales bacterium]